MDHKIYMNYIHSSTLLRQLSDLWRTDQLCDAVITVDKSIVAKAHKLMMFAVSPKLKSESQRDMQSPILDVKLPSGISHSSVHAFLQYLYEGFLILTRQVAKDLVEISKFLEINSLMNCCKDFLKESGETCNPVLLSDLSKASFPGEFSHIRHIAMEGKDIAKKQSVLDDGGAEKSQNISESSSKDSSVDKSDNSSEHNSHFKRTSDTSHGNQKKRKQSDIDTDDSVPPSEKKRSEMPTSQSQPVKAEAMFESCGYQLTLGAANSESGSQQTSTAVIDNVASNLPNSRFQQPNEDTSSSRDSPDVTIVKVEQDEDVPEALSSFQSYPSDSHDSSWYSQDNEYEQAMTFDTGASTLTAQVGAPRYELASQMPRPTSHTLASSSRQSDQQQEYMVEGAEPNMAGDDSTEALEYQPSNRLHERISRESVGSSQHTCRVCNAVFSHATWLNRHMQVHHNSAWNYECEICHKNFQEKFHYECHVNEHHNVKAFKCLYCNKVFSKEASLNRHMRGENYLQRHECEICHKKFRDKIHYEGHVKSHQNAKTFKCFYCQKEFVYRHSLALHCKSCLGKQNQGIS